LSCLFSKKPIFSGNKKKRLKIYAANLQPPIFSLCFFLSLLEERKKIVRSAALFGQAADPLGDGATRSHAYPEH
jgi:hypothetical protein